MTTEARERRMAVILQMLVNAIDPVSRRDLWREYEWLHSQRDQSTVERMERERGLAR